MKYFRYRFIDAPEELYDLENDPYELVNLASDPQHEHVLNRLRSRLKSYVLETKDLGYLYESEMVLRAGGKPPYYLRNNKELYDIERLFGAAEKVGKAGPDEIIQLLQQD
nr:hypothetical protein [Bacteroidales bacterium]